MILLRIVRRNFITDFFSTTNKANSFQKSIPKIYSLIKGIKI